MGLGLGLGLVRVIFSGGFPPENIMGLGLGLVRGRVRGRGRVRVSRGVSLLKILWG